MAGAFPAALVSIELYQQGGRNHAGHRIHLKIQELNGGPLHIIQYSDSVAVAAKSTVGRYR